MKPIRILIFLVVLVAGVGAIYWTFVQTPRLASVESDDHGHGHGHGHGESQDEKGPHGGRLLEDDGFELEITLFESGMQPKFHVHPSFEDQPVPLDAIDLTITLSRFGGREDLIKFEPMGDYLLGDVAVEEPHSFEVEVHANYQGKNYHFHYDSHEGRTELSVEAQSRAGIKTEAVQSATIREALTVYGRVQLNEERVKHISPRYSGIMTSALKHFGDIVARDETVARVENNDSLREYEINSSIGGEIIWVHAHQGEFVKEGQPIYEVADLSSLWVEVDVFSHDLSRVRVGQNVLISFGNELPAVESKIDYLSPFGSEKSQTTLARIVIDNSEGLLRPGMFVTAEIEMAHAEIPVAVPLTALQTFRDWDVVFMTDGNSFQAQPVELGRSDGKHVEIRAGLVVGQRIVTDGSFILKADIMKEGASHDH